MIGKC